MFEIALRNGWPTLAERMLALTKAIDNRVWWFQTPLRQLDMRPPLPPDALRNLEEKKSTIEQILDMGASRERASLSAVLRARLTRTIRVAPGARRRPGSRQPLSQLSRGQPRAGGGAHATLSRTRRADTAHHARYHARHSQNPSAVRLGRAISRRARAMVRSSPRREERGDTRARLTTVSQIQTADSDRGSARS